MKVQSDALSKRLLLQELVIILETRMRKLRHAMKI